MNWSTRIYGNQMPKFGSFQAGRYGVILIFSLLLEASSSMILGQEERSLIETKGEDAPADLIDPKIGTLGTGYGSCMPGPCLPHSSVYPSPDTDATNQPSGYSPTNNIVGFSQLHTQGTGGTPSFGNILITPEVGLRIPENDRSSPKENEKAGASSYSVLLTRDRIQCDLVPAKHSVLYRFTFPKSADSKLLVDVARKIGSSKALIRGDVTIDPAQGKITGGGIYGGNWCGGQYPLYFTAEISKKPRSYGTWIGTNQKAGSTQAEIKGTEGGAYVGISTKENEVVFVKIAVSFRSQAQSATWLAEEIPGWDFDGLCTRARGAWNDQLSSVTLEGADRGEAGRFYTGLFHTMVQPRDRKSDHWETGEPFWDDTYTLWDSWRTVFPMLGLADGRAFSGIVNSFLARHRHHHGYVPEAIVGGVETASGQGGNEVDNIITEAWLDRIPGIDWEEAYALQRYNAETMRTTDYKTKGYVSIEEPKTPYLKRMKSGAATIEFAYNDYCVAQLAKALGKQADYEKYLNRSTNWLNVWNPASAEGEFSGFPNARHQDGKFSNIPPAKGYNTDFYEGTCWIYSYRPTHDLPSLISQMGGRETFRKRLLFALKHGLIDFTNEPSFQTIWLFDALNRPYLASFWADRLRNMYSGLAMPGDEDNGAMSSLYCFLDLGIFPFAGQDIYYLHGGRLPHASFRLPNGKLFTINSQNASLENIYVQSANLNGKPLKVPYIKHEDIQNGGTLEFIMGAKPSDWGCAGEFDPARAAEEITAGPTLR
jgi:predicted alpha-1,2-mannosidase